VRDTPLTTEVREKIATCLGWQSDLLVALCRGNYQDDNMSNFSSSSQMIVMADQVSFYSVGQSELKGHVEIKSKARMVTAKTATLYRAEKTQRIKRIELHDNVHFIEPKRSMWAKKVVLNPSDHSGIIEEVLYRFDSQHAHAVLPAWGLARLIQRFKNKNILLKEATYSTCPPKIRDWNIEAREILLNDAKSRGVARDALLRVHDVPVFYTPYLSFPTSKARQTGFLMPIYGYSNIGGVDLAAPFYWNIAPNYDATITPHAYTRRGVMLGGESRFLTDHSLGMFSASILPNDKAFHHFLVSHDTQYPGLKNQSDNRWSVLLRDDTAFTDQLSMHLNYQHVSDDYYLQDFSSNLAVITESQLRQEGELTYTSEHWQLRGLAETYQTLNPINQATVNRIYERLPQLMAQGFYDELPLNGQFKVIGQFDQFQWPTNDGMQPDGPRLHLNPILSFETHESWGYIVPEVELVENNYHLSSSEIGPRRGANYIIPRYSIDSGLFLDNYSAWFGERYTQTLEPRLYYLNVPYQNQSIVPAFDSAYMIFTADQLFRTNRFSGQDRIGDANQLAYALTSRWLKNANGLEKASLTVGQQRYFTDRRVNLCYQGNGACEDTPLMLGYLAQNTGVSPIATRAMYRLNSVWSTSGDWVFDPNENATNNGNFNFQYQPEVNHMVRLGYSYLVNGNIFSGRNSNEIGHGALHQATLGYTWPLNSAWSGLGVYSYNLSEHYDMMAFLGAQYDSCCWAVRLLGGRVFNSLSPSTLKPEYNNNIYVQVLLKGLGSAGSSDPASTIQSYLPGYVNQFQR
jgi:LPS-assembly protein